MPPYRPFSKIKKRRKSPSLPYKAITAVANQLFVIAFAFFLISIRAFAGSDGVLVSILEVENDSLIVIEQLTGDAMILGLVLPTHCIANLLDGCGNTQDDSVEFCIGRRENATAFGASFSQARIAKHFPFGSIKSCT